MRIRNLMEDTEGARGCVFAHGLSFYIETKAHKLLVDLGPSAATLQNAEHLGIDLGQVDTVVLSHGHYDHSGGILAFAGKNPRAKIFMQQSAGGPFFADDGAKAAGGRFRYIGIDQGILKLPQVVRLDGDFRIDEELELFTVKHRNHALPFANRRLLVREEKGYAQDTFVHEQYLVIRDGQRSVLVSGCAHNGILSILDTYKEKYGNVPDVMISGFHLSQKTDYTDAQRQEIAKMANALRKVPTRFVTCHCTGLEAYALMRGILGSKLEYVHSGEEIYL